MDSMGLHGDGLDRGSIFLFCDSSLCPTRPRPSVDFRRRCDVLFDGDIVDILEHSVVLDRLSISRGSYNTKLPSRATLLVAMGSNHSGFSQHDYTCVDHAHSSVQREIMHRHTHAAAITALTARIRELQTRLDHAKYAGDEEKTESITKKLSRAMGRLARIKRKARD